MRHQSVHLELAVPAGNRLLAWVHEVHQRLAVDIVFLGATGQPLETLSVKAAYCVSYHEQFVSGDTRYGAYRCYLTLTDSNRSTLHAGGPAAAFVASPPGPHGKQPGAVVTTAAPAPSPKSSATIFG